LAVTSLTPFPDPVDQDQKPPEKRGNLRSDFHPNTRPARTPPEPQPNSGHHGAWYWSDNQRLWPTYGPYCHALRPPSPPPSATTPNPALPKTAREPTPATAPNQASETPTRKPSNNTSELVRCCSDHLSLSCHAPIKQRCPRWKLPRLAAGHSSVPAVLTRLPAVSGAGAVRRRDLCKECLRRNRRQPSRVLTLR
jgi:hypothetical protein